MTHTWASPNRPHWFVTAEHYLDNLAAPAGDLSGTVTLLTEANPRALADFGDPQWDY